jgi:pimeloyl-ACP methyl ester carboxylesterase
MTRLQATLPQAELRILAGQGHLATHTAPEVLAEEIVSFLETRPPPMPPLPPAASTS